MEKTIVELFAGVGGFRLGFERNSEEWNTVWFSQWEPDKKTQWAHDCYVQHFGDIDENTGIDISLVNKNNIPDHSLLVGGFPCQDYSVAHGLNTERGIEGKKGILWWQIKATLEEKQTPFVLLENVDRLLKSPAKQRGRDFGMILFSLYSLGYSVEWRVINAADYGAGQKRRRTFIFAYKNNTVYGQNMANRNSVEIVNNAGFFATVFPIRPIDELRNTPLSEDMEHLQLSDIYDNFSFNFGKAGYFHNGIIYTTDITPVYENPIPLQNLLEHNVSEEFFLEGEILNKWEQLKSSHRIERTAKNGHKYIFSEGAIPFPDRIDIPARTMLTSEGTTNRSSHIILDPDNNRYRILTPIETERIQGFDDNWTNTGMPKRFRYFCMGNALVVPLVTRMAERLGIIIENEP